MNQRAWSLVTKGLFLLWLFGVVVAYYVVHKPLALANVLAVGGAVAGLIGAGLLVALGTGIGLLLLQRVDMTPASQLVWAAAVGLGAVSLVGLALGAVGLLRPWLLWLLLVAGLSIVGRWFWGGVRAAWADPTWRPQSQFEAFLAGYCGLTMIFALAWALAPPVAWDGLVYHLTVPKLFLATGRVSHPLDLPYMGFPQLLEMLFAWGMGLAGEQAAAPIHWFYGLLAGLSLVTAGRRWLRGTAGWLAAAVLFTARSIVLLVGWPYVDMGLLLYVTLAFLSLVRFLEDDPQSRRWLALSGVFAGLALSTKYTALALLPALGLAFLSQTLRARFRARDLQFAIRSLFLLCSVAMMIWSPWLLKNFLLTGNPTYPFFFGGVHWDDWRAWWYDRPGTGLLYTEPWRLFTAPWDATIWGVEGATGYSATIGPLLLGFLPFLLLVWRWLPAAQRRWLRTVLVFCGVLYGFWLWGVARTALLMQTRLLFPAFGLLALIVGAVVEGLRSLPHRPLDVGWLARAVVLGVLGLTLVATFLSTTQARPLGVLLGHESRGEFLARRLGWYYTAVEHINRDLFPDAVVLFLWEPRSYHCLVECRPDALLDRFLDATHLQGPHADAIAASWRAEGVTHVLFYRRGYEVIHDAGFDPLTDDDVATLDELRRHELQEVRSFGDAYVLYRLRE